MIFSIPIQILMEPAMALRNKLRLLHEQRP